MQNYKLNWPGAWMSSCRFLVFHACFYPREVQKTRKGKRVIYFRKPPFVINHSGLTSRGLLSTWIWTINHSVMCKCVPLPALLRTPSCPWPDRADCLQKIPLSYSFFALYFFVSHFLFLFSFRSFSVCNSSASKRANRGRSEGGIICRPTLWNAASRIFANAPLHIGKPCTCRKLQLPIT